MPLRHVIPPGDSLECMRARSPPFFKLGWKVMAPTEGGGEDVSRRSSLPVPDASRPAPNPSFPAPTANGAPGCHCQAHFSAAMRLQHRCRTPSARNPDRAGRQRPPPQGGRAMPSEEPILGTAKRDVLLPWHHFRSPSSSPSPSRLAGHTWAPWPARRPLTSPCAPAAPAEARSPHAEPRPGTCSASSGAEDSSSGSGLRSAPSGHPAALKGDAPASGEKRSQQFGTPRLLCSSVGFGSAP